MADVSVEFGAKDTGLENTLKTIQDQLVALDGELKSGTLSFDEINKKMREAAQAEKLHQSLGGTKDQIEALGLSFKQAKPEIEKFTENQKEAARESQKASASFQTITGEMIELRAALEKGNLSADEFDKTLSRLKKLEGIQQKMDAFKQSTTGAGDSAEQASPDVEELGTDIKQTGKEAEDFGEKSKVGFLKMSGAVAAGQLAAEAAMAGIRAAVNLVRGSIDEFGAALNLGGRLSDLAARTGEAEGNLLLLERAFQNTGAGAEAVGPAINKLQNFMQGAAEGGSTQTAAMEKLGLSMEMLAGKTPIQQFEIFAQRIAGIEDPTLRTALAMDIFGRSGGELLPLLTNFSSELGIAQGQLGSMVDIMNQNAATFDAVGDRISIVRGKFTEFAAGILSSIIPALDAITEGLSRIDAAALGQKFADAFIGGTQAMSGFQAAVDAFQVGKIQEALSLLWESVKLQSLETANEIGRNLVAGFSTSIDFLQEIFSPSGAIAQYMLSTFVFLGAKFQEALGNGILAFLDALPGWLTRLNPIMGAVAGAIRTNVTAATEEANDRWNLLYHSTGEVATQIAGAASRIKDNMNVNLSETGDLIGGLNERSEALKLKQDEVTAAVEKTNEAKRAGLEITPIEESNVRALLEEEKKRLENELATARVKGDAAEKTFAQIESEIELNRAIASGNQEEVKRVQQKQKQAEIAAEIKGLEESIPAIIQDIIDKTGTSEETAKGLAEQLVASQIAALKISANASSATENLNQTGEAAKTVRGEIEGIANAKMEASPERLRERTKEARNELKDMRDFIGQDLSQMSLDNILTKLGLDPGSFQTTDQKLTALEGALNAIGNADPADITPDVDLVGVNDRLEAVKSYLAGIKKPDATPEINQQSLQGSVNDSKTQINSALGAMQATVAVTPQVDQVELANQIGQMQAEITNNFTGGEGGPGGQGGEGGQGGRGGDATADIESLVQLLSPWTQIITTIRDRLPLQALAY